MSRYFVKAQLMDESGVCEVFLYDQCVTELMAGLAVSDLVRALGYELTLDGILVCFLKFHFVNETFF